MCNPPQNELSLLPETLLNYIVRRNKRIFILQHFQDFLVTMLSGHGTCGAEEAAETQEQQSNDQSQQVLPLDISHEISEVQSLEQTTGATNTHIAGGKFDRAILGTQNIHLTKGEICGSDLQGANLGTQHISQVTTYNINNTYWDKAGDAPSTSSGTEKHTESIQDWTKLTDSIRFNNKNPLSRQGNVYAGELTSRVCGPRKLAIKIIPYNEKNAREAQMLLKLSPHPHVVGIVHSDMYHNTHMYIAMDLCNKLNLHDLIIENRKRGVPFDSKKSVKHALQLIEGLNHIHKNKILHRDLKPHNVLLSLDGHTVKISDFGLSKEMKSGRSVTAQSTQRVGTDGYRAPETYNSDVISEQADIFSLGLVLYFIWSDGHHPYGDDPDFWNAYIKKNMNRNIDGIRIPDAHMAKQLLEWILQFSPKERPSTEQILSHAYVISAVSKQGHESGAMSDAAGTTPSICGASECCSATLRQESAPVKRKHKKDATAGPCATKCVPPGSAAQRQPTKRNLPQESRKHVMEDQLRRQLSSRSSRQDVSTLHSLQKAAEKLGFEWNKIKVCEMVVFYGTERVMQMSLKDMDVGYRIFYGGSDRPTEEGHIPIRLPENADEAIVETLRKSECGIILKYDPERLMITAEKQGEAIVSRSYINSKFPQSSQKFLVSNEEFELFSNYSYLEDFLNHSKTHHYPPIKSTEGVCLTVGTEPGKMEGTHAVKIVLKPYACQFIRARSK